MRAILEPIQEDLSLVERQLTAVAEIDFPQLSQVLGHVVKRGGKRIRPALTLLAGKCFNYNQDLLIPMAIGVELLHNATLLHDDAIDGAAMRRGLPTVDSLWGDEVAILAGDYLFAKSAEMVAATGNLRVIRLFAQTLMTICSGELEEHFSTRDLRQSRQQYYNRSSQKTASLFATAAESGAILSDAPEEAVQALKGYGHNLGLAFQIVDDILDFTGDELELGKPVGADLLQGTLTLPAILLLERSQDNPIKEIFQSRDNEDGLKQAVEAIRTSPAIAESYAVAQDFADKARQALDVFPDSTSRRALLELAGIVIQRRG